MNPMKWPVWAGFLTGLTLFLTVVSADAIRYDSGNRRDPFVPLIGPEGALLKGFNSSGINVEGIIYDPPYGSLVLISGEYYQEGENFQGANLISIQRDRVVLQDGSEERVLFLQEDLSKQSGKK